VQDFFDIKIHATYETYETSAMNSMDPNMMGMWGMGGASAAINGGVHGATGRPDPLLVTVITHCDNPSKNVGTLNFPMFS